MKRMWILLVTMAMVGTLAAYAQTEQAQSEELQQQTRELDDTALEMGNEKTLDMLSEQLGISRDVLAAQKQDSNLGYGELFIANSLAQSLQESDPSKDFNALVQEYQSGKGWGEIANENGLKLGSVVSNMKRSNTAMEQEQRHQVRTTEQQQTSSGPQHRAGQRQNTGSRGHNGAGRGRK